MSSLTKPSEMFQRDVEPALDDYLKEPLSERRANILAAALDHHLDWTYEYLKAGDQTRLGLKDFRRSRIAECPDLQMMNDLSDSKHHRVLDRNNDPPRTVKLSTAAYKVENGQLHVPQYGKAFEPSA